MKAMERKMMSEEYNGWTNRATWFMASEMDNRKTWTDRLDALVAANASTEEFEKVGREFFSSILSDEKYLTLAEFGEVDWNNIRSTLFADHDTAG